MAGSSGPPLLSDSEDDDALLAKSEYLTREEVMKRRLRRVRRLIKFYRRFYWFLMEEVRRKHREYYWIYGKSPCVVVRDHNAEEGENCDVNNGDNVGTSDNLGSFRLCSYPGCKVKAMALTRYCILHIMEDPNQMLYKRCKYPQLRDGGRLGSLLCGKAIIKSTTPSLCQKHVLEAKKHISQALKKGGVSATLSNKLATKFHLVITEYVHLIQSRRRDNANRNIGKAAVEDGERH